MPFLLLMPSYNQAHYIAEAVRSVLAQDDPDWELWILDNSTDHTPAVMGEFNDPRIHFHHDPERMDPGSALNWMLERAHGDCFSYLHTDNNLATGYVRSFKAALSSHELALAYCDMHLIDARGRRFEHYQRGVFDLPRLLSFDTLGVPFAATTRLVDQLGGFSVEDVADDARFCIAAYGLARFVYIGEPLLDYRLHRGSRTKAAGGDGMRRAFLGAVMRAVPTLEQRGLAPRQVMAREAGRILSELESLTKQLWDSNLARRLPARWQAAHGLDHTFEFGASGWTAPSRPLMNWFFDLNRDQRRHAKRANSVLLPWAHTELGVSIGATPRFRVRSMGFRTLWAARQLETKLGWTPLLDSAITAPPDWLTWKRSNGTEPILDCTASEVRFLLPGSSGSVGTQAVAITANRPTLLYIGHSYHRQTASTAFFLDLLRRDHEVTVHWDESWLPGHERVSAAQINALNPDVVVFFQLVPTRHELRRIRCQRLFLIPMHDYVVAAPPRRWKRIQPSGLRVVNFCRATHSLFTALGFESLPVQYWPPNIMTSPRDTGHGLRVMFWMRRQEISWPLLKQVLGPQRPEQIILRVAADPGGSVELPDDNDLREYRVQVVTGWQDKDQYLRLLESCNLFIAPRLHEGIGQSFLEAMAMGLAVVAPDSPTMNEYITHGRNGYLYDFAAPRPIDFTSLAAVRECALRDVAAGHQRWLKDAPRILELIAGEAPRRPGLRWRLLGL